MKISIFLFILGSSILLASCKKELGNNSNCITSSVEITTNSPVIEGWPLTLSTYNEEGLLYKWIAPNGSEISYSSGSPSNREKLTTTLADSGLYKVELRAGDGCLLFAGSTKVEIIPVPLPPCNIANNSSTSNIIGIGGDSYNNVSFIGSGGIYTVQSKAGGGTITFHFNGNEVPKPGIYKTSGYFAMDEKTVGMFISNGGYDFKNTGNVYVNKVNGKTQFSFCDCIFTNPLSAVVLKISARFTEP